MNRHLSKENEEAFSIKEFPDMRMFMSSALRYSLGRKSHAPGFFLDFLSENMDGFSKGSLQIFYADLKEFLHHYGHHEDAVIAVSVIQARAIQHQILKRLDQ